MSREKNLIKNTIILSIGTLLPKLASFITLPIYTSYLTKAEYGIYDLIFTIISLVIPIVTLQIQTAAFRKLIDAKSDKEKSKLISTVGTFCFSIGIIFFLVFVSLFFKVDLNIRILCATFLLMEMFVQVVLQMIRGLGENRTYSIGSIINSFFNVILVIPLLVFMKQGLIGLILSLTISLLIELIYLVCKSKLYKYYSLKKYNKEYLKELLKYSIPMIPNSISWWIVNASDRLIISFFLGIEQNAIYAAANKIPSLYNLFYNTFNMAWQESASRSSNDSDVNEYYSQTLNTLFSFLTGGMLMLLSITPFVFKLLINDSYFEAYYQMPILYLSLYILSFSNYIGGIYVAMQQTKKLAKSVLVGAIFNIVINIALINKIGIYAASISTLISYILVLIIRAVDIRKSYKLHLDKKNIIVLTIMFAIVTIIYYSRNLYALIMGIMISSLAFLYLNYNILIKFLNKFIFRRGNL